MFASSSSKQLIYSTAVAAVGKGVAHAAYSSFNSSRTEDVLQHEDGPFMTRIRPSRAPTEENGGSATYTMLLTKASPLSDADNSRNAFHNNAKMLEKTSSGISLSLDSMQLTAVINRSFSAPSIYQQSSSLPIENTTNSSRDQMPTERDLLLIILVPIAVVIAIIAVIVLLRIYWKKKQLRNRASKLERSVENSLSWFEAFDMQHSLGTWGVMNDLSEPAEFSIPMGPLSVNNLAFDNYKTTIEDSMMDRYSTKSILGRDFSQIKRGSEVHPSDHAFHKGFDLEKAKSKQISRSIHVNTGAEFESTGT